MHHDAIRSGIFSLTSCWWLSEPVCMTTVHVPLFKFEWVPVGLMFKCSRHISQSLVFPVSTYNIYSLKHATDFQIFFQMNFIWFFINILLPIVFTKKLTHFLIYQFEHWLYADISGYGTSRSIPILYTIQCIDYTV